MRVLVTGGAGFIGSHLCEFLLGRGDQVVAIDCLNSYYNPVIKRRNLQLSLAHKNFSFIEADILDEKALQAMFDRYSFDVVVHLAARAGVRPSLEQPLLYEEVNCRGTLLLLEQMRKRGIRRFVFASSSSVYGNVKEVPFREDARIDRPVSPYAATKAAGELYCYNYFHLYGISATALRFFTVCGPRQRPDMAIHKFTALIDAGKPVPFYGDGSTERDYTYYADIVQGVVGSIDHDLGFEILNLGESQSTTLAQLLALIEQGLGKKAILDRQPMQPGDVNVTFADISKAKRLIAYNPTTGIEKSVEHFIQWYRAQKHSA